MAVSEQIQQAIEILKALGMPMQSHGELRAHILLALANITPGKSWQNAESPMIGTRATKDFAGTHHKKVWAENSREQIRDEGLHYFVAAAIALKNPDEPTRPTVSPKTVYQLEPSALAVIKAYGTKDWEAKVKEYQALGTSLVAKYAKAREHSLVPVKIAEGKEITLSPGGHGELIKKIIEDFGPRFAPGSDLLYVGDTALKWGKEFEEALEKQIGFKVGASSRMPDVILFSKEKGWLYLIEAVASSGPVDGKRYDELKALFGKLGFGIIYVTAFPDFRMMGRFLQGLMWDTEVWVASDPTHLIHFNGDRFLGPR